MNAPEVARRLAVWWGRLYTRAAPEPDRSARREELAADLHDQLAEARASAVPGGRVAQSVVGRVLRGVPADLAWRFALERAPARMDWHLTHPGTLLTGLFVLLVPTTLLADAARGPVSGLGPFLDVLASTVVLLSAAAVGVAGVAMVRWLLAEHSPARSPDLSGCETRGRVRHVRPLGRGGTVAIRACL